MSLSNIKNLVLQGASERELQTELKRNLSILGAACAPMEREYIAFSEFPLAHGNVDFVVFTSRSRMSVIFIEIKGADFNFLNDNGNIATKINTATQQIRDRFSYISSNYLSFRRDVHIIRKTVEDGTQKYNSVLGPNGYLHVDPEKDVSHYGIVIGGRTKNDLDESRARNDFEMNTPKIRLESWDSWLRKHTSTI